MQYGTSSYAFESLPDPISVFCGQECRFFNGISCCDVLIVDYEMPGMNGFDFLTQQKKKNCKIGKVAMISGGWNTKRLSSVAKLGYKTFAKPLPMGEFNNWLTDR